jgi:predicted transcriptional regulator
MERDFDDPTTWEADPSPVGSSRPALRAQITVRLDEHLAARLRDIAQGRRVGYTALIRQWVEERLRWEDAAVQLPLTYVEAGFTTTPPKAVDVKFGSRAPVTVG